MEYQKLTNFLDTTSDNVPRFITKKWVEVYDQSGSDEDGYKPSKQIRFKTSMLRSDLCDFSDANIAVKGTCTIAKKTFVAADFTAPNNTQLLQMLSILQVMPHLMVNWLLKIMHHLFLVFQKSVIHLLTMQKTWML